MDNGQNIAKKEKKSTAKKVLTIVGNTLIWLFVIFAVVVTVLAFAAQTNNDGIPTIGGKVILTVLTPSMEPGTYEGAPQYEDSFYQGDIIIGQKLSPEEQTTLKVGEIISYQTGDLNGDNIDDINSHRIVEIVTMEDGGIAYITKGDHNAMPDTAAIRPAQIISKYTGTRIPKLGTFLNFLQTPNGFLICIVIPLVLFFIYELVMFIRKFLQVKNGDKKQITAADEELIRQRAVEEYIKAQQAAALKQQAETQKADETPAAPDGSAETPETPAAPDGSAETPETPTEPKEN